MDSLEVAGRLLAGMGLILANGFFVAIEFALTRVRQYPKAAFDTPGLRRAWEMTQDLEIYLTSCQVGISATSIAVGIVAEPALAGLIEPFIATTQLAAIGAGGALAFLIINIVHLTHGEQTPTYLGVERTQFVARYGATPLYWFAKLIAPMIIIGDGVAKWTLRRFGIEMTGAWLETDTERVSSRAELRHRLGSMLDESDLTDERKDEVLNALLVGEQPVKEVMTPVEKIVFLSTAVSTAENMRRIGQHAHTRFPLIEGTPEEFLGIIYTPMVIDNYEQLIDKELTFEEIATTPMTVTETTPISEAVDQLQASQQELALVVSEEHHPSVVGLVTATDALESIVGRLEDPIDVATKSER